MATATGKAFWLYCSNGAACSYAAPSDKAKGRGRRFLGALDVTGKAYCAPCGSAKGEAKRPTADAVFSGTDGQEGRKAAVSVQLPKVAQGSHKALHTEGGKLKGGTPAPVAKAVQAKLPKVAKAPKVAAPKVAAKATTAKEKAPKARPKAKTA